jgi:hypothetical protein
MARRYDEALSRADDMVEHEPRYIQGHTMRVYALLALARFEDAASECDLIVDLEHDAAGSAPTPRRAWPDALRGYALARANRRSEAESIAASLQERARVQYVPPHHEALVLHALGRDGEALRALRRAVDNRDVFVTFLGVDPKWDALRTSQEFAALLERLNLVDVSMEALRRAR